MSMNPQDIIKGLSNLLNSGVPFSVGQKALLSEAGAFVRHQQERHEDHLVRQKDMQKKLDEVTALHGLSEKRVDRLLGVHKYLKHHLVELANLTESTD